MTTRENLPEYCRLHCPAARKEEFDEYPVYFDVNCEGPVVSESGTTSVTRLYKDGRAIEEIGDPAKVGQLACINNGLNSSIKALVNNQG